MCAQRRKRLPGNPVRFLAGLLALSGAVVPEAADPAIAIWDKSVNLRAALGYRDNLLLDRQATQHSPFVATGLEFMAYRLNTAGLQFTFFLDGEDLRYLDARGVDKEQTVIAQAQLKKPWAQVWTGTLDLESLYQNQMFDASFTETERTAVKAEGVGLTFRPGLRRELPAAFFVEARAPLTRQWFKAPLDSYWEAGPRVLAGRGYGHRSEVTLSYAFLDRPYDHRQRTAADGTPIPGTRLVYQSHEAAWTWQHYWEARRRWRMTTRGGFLVNHDNGAGYYDYTRSLLAHQWRYRASTWEIQAQVRMSHYQYDRQPVSDTDPARRRKTFLALNLRGEMHVTKPLKWYAEFEYEQSLANSDFETYTVNTVRSGFDWGF